MLIIPHYRTKTFNEVFANADAFVNGYKGSGLYKQNLIEDATLAYLYYLLSARYGYNPICTYNADNFKMKIYMEIFKGSGNWAKEMAVQEKLRSLTFDANSQLFQGSKVIYNHANNPSTTPSTSSLEELTYIDDQNTTNYKKGLLEAINSLEELLRMDVTETYMNKFKKYFNPFITPLYYTYEEEENDGE